MTRILILRSQRRDDASTLDRTRRVRRTAAALVTGMAASMILLGAGAAHAEDDPTTPTDPNPPIVTVPNPDPGQPPIVSIPDPIPDPPTQDPPSQDPPSQDPTSKPTSKPSSKPASKPAGSTSKHTTAKHAKHHHHAASSTASSDDVPALAVFASPTPTTALLTLVSPPKAGPTTSGPAAAQPATAPVAAPAPSATAAEADPAVTDLTLTSAGLRSSAHQGAPAWLPTAVFAFAAVLVLAWLGVRRWRDSVVAVPDGLW